VSGWPELGLAAGQLPAYVEVKDATVKWQYLDSRIMRALVVLGHVHTFLFDKTLILTSANDGTHAANSKHYRNLAADVRSKDKSEAENVVFAAILTQQYARLGVSFFREAAGTPNEHWHLEVAG
jgi:hypothetical protein